MYHKPIIVIEDASGRQLTSDLQGTTGSTTYYRQDLVNLKVTAETEFRKNELREKLENLDISIKHSLSEKESLEAKLRELP